MECQRLNLSRPGERQVPYQSQIFRNIYLKKKKKQRKKISCQDVCSMSADDLGKLKPT